MLVRYLMTRSVITVGDTDRCRDVLRLFRDRRIRRAPVVRDGRMVGMVSERDLLRALPSTIGELETRAGKNAEEQTIGRIMSTDVASLDVDDHAEHAAQQMIRHKIGGMPVLDDGVLVGIVTESDVFRAFVALTEPGDATRLTLADHAASRAHRDPLSICLAHGLCIERYHTHDRPGGIRAHVLHVLGDDIKSAIAALEAAGFVLVACEAPNAKSAA